MPLGQTSTGKPSAKQQKLPSPEYAQRLVARNLRRIRIDLGMTQEQVADGSDTTPVWISGCERGVRNLSVRSLSMIAHALGVSMADLLDTASYPEPPAGRIYKKRSPV